MPLSSSNSAQSSNQQSTQQSTGTTRGYTTSDQYSQSYIPEYSQTPILEEIAKYSRELAPQAYQWGLDQFDKNQGDIDGLMRNALSYASPQRLQASMGQAEAGVQQGAEAGRQSAIRDLQSFGIDPSSGRYAALDNASRVTSAAAAAGAGNQQRMADTAQGNTMQNQAIAAGNQNVQTGYNAANTANAFLGTASNLKYDPLGTASASSSTSANLGDTQSSGQSTGASLGSSQSGQTMMPGEAAAQTNAANNGGFMSYAPLFKGWMAEGGPVPNDDATQGGFVSHDLSPSGGAQTDDVQANLNAGEFVIPKDVAAWKGQEFFYKLMAQARKTRMMAGSGGEAGSAPPSSRTGYAVGGPIMANDGDERRPFPDDEAQFTPVLFAGEHSQTADRPALAQAKTMLKQGFELDDIGRRTGWDVGPNRRWMYEIPDDQSRINMDAVPKTAARPGQSPLSGPTVPAKDVLIHPALQAAYPKMFNSMRIGRVSDPRDYGMYDPDANALTLGQPRDAPKEDPRRIALHELTHGIQAQEDFQPGGGPELFKQKGKSTPFDQYFRLKGEAEARNVADRMNLSPEERVGKRWWETSDVQLKDQINHPYYRHGKNPTWDRLTKD